MEIEENKDFVGMENCFFCGKVKHLLLNKRMNKTFPKNAVYNEIPCEDCKLIMKVGVLFIGCRNGEKGQNPYRTGQIIGVEEKAVKKLIQEPLLTEVLKQRVCFIEEDVLKKIGLINKKGGLKYKNINRLKSLKEKDKIIRKL